jgi:hypothetical protein
MGVVVVSVIVGMDMEVGAWDVGMRMAVLGAQQDDNGCGKQSCADDMKCGDGLGEERKGKDCANERCSGEEALCSGGTKALCGLDIQSDADAITECADREGGGNGCS